MFKTNAHIIRTYFLTCAYVRAYHNPSLGFVTKVKACKSVGQEGSLGVTSYTVESAGKCERMNLHTPK
jgi:hypothetical protein